MDVLKNTINEKLSRRPFIVEEILFMKVALSFYICSFLSSCAIGIKLGSGKVARSHASHCHTAGLLLFFSFACPTLARAFILAEATRESGFKGWTGQEIVRTA